MKAVEVKRLERAGWGERAESYGLLTGRITARLVEPLLDAAGIRPGTRLLDVGTGPGTAARRAAERGATATGVDLAGPVVALARRRHGGVRFLQADAEELSFVDRSFDALVCNFTINHLPQPERAMREFARVVAPGGGIALTTWDLTARNRFLGILADAIRAAGVNAPDAPAGPDPYRFADGDEFRALLRGAHLVDIGVRSLSLTHRVADADELWHGLLGGSVRTAGLVEAQTPSVRDRIRAAVERLAEQHRVDGQLVIPVSVKLAHGWRP